MAFDLRLLHLPCVQSIPFPNHILSASPAISLSSVARTQRACLAAQELPSYAANAIILGVACCRYCSCQRRLQWLSALRLAKLLNTSKKCCCCCRSSCSLMPLLVLLLQISEYVMPSTAKWMLTFLKYYKLSRLITTCCRRCSCRQSLIVSDAGIMLHSAAL